MPELCLAGLPYRRDAERWCIHHWEATISSFHTGLERSRGAPRAEPLSSFLLT